MYKRSNNLTIRIASPILELPFKAHNSEMFGESEQLRQRMWSVNLGNIDFQSYHANIQGSKHGLGADHQQLDEYERFKLVIDSIGLRVSN